MLGFTTLAYNSNTLSQMSILVLIIIPKYNMLLALSFTGWVQEVKTDLVYPQYLL